MQSTAVTPYTGEEAHESRTPRQHRQNKTQPSFMRRAKRDKRYARRRVLLKINCDITLERIFVAFVILVFVFTGFMYDTNTRVSKLEAHHLD